MTYALKLNITCPLGKENVRTFSKKLTVIQYHSYQIDKAAIKQEKKRKTTQD